MTAGEEIQAVEKVNIPLKNQYVENQLIVKFKSNVGVLDKSATSALKSIKGSIGEVISTNAMKAEKMQKSMKNFDILVVNTELSTMDAIRILKNSDDVEYAEPNWIYGHYAVSNDLYYTNGTLWGMYGDATSPANQYGSQAGEAWARGVVGSSNVWIGIIDEGYMYTHPDLAANAGKNPGEVAGNGVDDDGNGYVDDIYGWDFDGNNSSLFDGAGDDHGTHCAGTIGGVGGNGSGVAGVCWNVKMMGGKFLGNRGGTTANAIKAVDYFTDLKTRHGLNFVATSNSWGGGGFSQALYDAIERANGAGILFIAAAGNETNNNDANLSYPGSYTNANIISVASITNTGALSSFSNYGATTVDLGAPGSAIMSTVPKSSKGKVISGYASYSGTSMATPHVSGAAALYASTHPGATAAQIRAALLSSVVATASLNGKCVTGGRLNVSGF
ncbi:MAG TPA: peptidase S8 [Bacteroidales bacterium]|nr:peptidase S8 [Bacteroidales bacterium]